MLKIQSKLKRTKIMEKQIETSLLLHKEILASLVEHPELEESLAVSISTRLAARPARSLPGMPSGNSGIAAMASTMRVDGNASSSPQLSHLTNHPR